MSTGFPKMSSSPTRGVPLTTCRVPRDPSSEPVPSERVKRWVEARTEYAAAIARIASGTLKPGPDSARRGPLPVIRRLTWSGVRSGRLLRTSAATPEVMAVACEVPLPRKNRVPRRPELPKAWSTNEPGTRRPCTWTPGATTSTRRELVPLLLNRATVSSVVLNVLFVSSAPTAIRYGSMAGSTRRVPPLLPAETTTTIPLRQATSAAYASGSSTYDWVESVPNERLSTRMLRPGSWACCTTQSMPAMTCETSLRPKASATLTLTMRASGAMPWYAEVSLELAPVPGSRAAIRPAMNVPWPNVSRCAVPANWDSNDRSGPLTTWPSAARPWTGVTPESMSATSMPLPV